MSDAEIQIQDEQEDAHLQEELDFSFLNDALEEDLSHPSEQEVQEVFSAPEEHSFASDDTVESFVEAEEVWESVPEAEDAWESVSEAEVVAEPEPVSSAPAGPAVDEFNLSTLNQLVDEIRQESQRVSEMKASVVKALALIHEMSESLKS